MVGEWGGGMALVGTEEVGQPVGGGVIRDGVCVRCPPEAGDSMVRGESWLEPNLVVGDGHGPEWGSWSN